MACTNFPKTGLVVDVTEHTVGDTTYVWDGIGWKPAKDNLTGEDIILQSGQSVQYYVDNLDATEVSSTQGNVQEDIDSLGNLVDQSSEAIKAILVAQGLSGEYGFFVDGFTYVSEGDVGIDSTGKIWIYVGAGAPNRVVAAGTVPSVATGYEQVTFNAAENIKMVNGESVHKFTTQSRQAIESVYKAQGCSNVFFFEDGFTYTESNDVGIYEDGTAWNYAGALPATIAAETIPDTGTGYQQVTFNTASGISNANGGSVQDYLNTHTVASPVEAQLGADDEKIMTPRNVKQVLTSASANNLLKADILQEEGTATDKLMSQNAITVAIQAAIESANHTSSYSTAAWDSVSDTITGGTGVTIIHENMKRCLLLDDGTVNYYLDPNNSNLKADGSASVLTGADGQVMVEIPKCYVKVSKVANKVTWSLSSEPRYGYVLHPAFTKDGTLQYDNKLDMWYYVGVTQEVGYVYVGAYQASVYDESGGAYIDGLNSDNNTARVDSGADKLSSVVGKYPMVGLARSEFRTLANNRGAGWNQMDFWTHSLLQLLYTTEYRDLNSQSAVSQGVVSITGGYPVSSDIQVDSPHSVSGKSNSVGNQTGGVESSTRDVPWMSYRGVENFWGNCYVWLDGVNVLDQVYYNNNTGSFTDDTVGSGYSQLGAQTPTDNGYIRNVQNNTLVFIPESVVDGASSIAFSDYYYQSTGYRVMIGGGNAASGARAGAFLLHASASSGDRSRTFGGRVIYK